MNEELPVTVTLPPVVRNYKDTLFRMLFKEKPELLQLYNALNGSRYEDPEELVVETLENAIYMGVKNDISFVLNSELNLYEHQSTYNPNMPLRDLIYVAKQLEKLISSHSVYSSTLLRIPVPRFVVFYNGTEEQPVRKIMKLSEAFEKETPEPELELKVLMLSINPGQNEELKESCQTLKEYCIYVETVRRYAKVLPIREAVEKAVTECIQKGILRDFLTRQRAEVIAVSIFEYNEEEELKKLRNAEYQAGEQDGYRAGERNGYQAGKTEAILELLKDLGDIPDSLRNRILQEKDPAQLTRWLKAAARASSLEVFLEEI